MEVEVDFAVFLTLELDEGEWTASGLFMYVLYYHMMNRHDKIK